MDKKWLKAIQEHNDAINALKELLDKYENIGWVPVEELLLLVSQLTYLKLAKPEDLTSLN